jgi:hypothetical protein
MWCARCQKDHQPAPVGDGRAFLVREGVLSARSCLGCRRLVLGFAFVAAPCGACAGADRLTKARAQHAAHVRARIEHGDGVDETALESRQKSQLQ